ncbi:MAG TPA: hypothetical protein DDW27_13590 [Bacteroidales bacterium]|nr:hypothetical protein [Bacteroidales bacterium]
MLYVKRLIDATYFGDFLRQKLYFCLLCKNHKHGNRKKIYSKFRHPTERTISSFEVAKAALNQEASGNA